MRGGGYRGGEAREASKHAGLAKRGMWIKDARHETKRRQFTQTNVKSCKATCNVSPPRALSNAAAAQQTLSYTGGRTGIGSAQMQELPPRHNRGGPALAVPAFVIGLFGILLLVHFLVPEPEDHARSSSTSPIHQKR